MIHSILASTKMTAAQSRSSSAATSVNLATGWRKHKWRGAEVPKAAVPGTSCGILTTYLQGPEMATRGAPWVLVVTFAIC
jgi:hypothetical protein